ncbi:MAG: hypothetical protein JWM98_1955 [Thermoleophilia bacterium]|nr:hypothetical protein [Thermoleophilia bacterium]
MHIDAQHVLLVAIGALLATWVVLLARLDNATMAVRAAEEGMRDAATGMLTPAGFELAVLNELAWARREGVTMALVVYEVRALEWRSAIARARERIRGHEHAGLLGARRFGVLLWDTDSAGVRSAAARLGLPLFGDEVLRVEVGWAVVPPGAADATATVAGLADEAVRTLEPLAPLAAAVLTRDDRTTRAA